MIAQHFGRKDTIALIIIGPVAACGPISGAIIIGPVQAGVQSGERLLQNPAVVEQFSCVYCSIILRTEDRYFVGVRQKTIYVP